MKTDLEQKDAKDTKGLTFTGELHDRNGDVQVRFVRPEEGSGVRRLFHSGWLFGVIPDLEIPGFSVVMTPEAFVQAVRANGVPHFVVETPGGWLLHPKMCKAEFRSAGNPEGEYVNTQIGLYVPRPE